MNRRIFTAIAATLLTGAGAVAQSAYDAYTITPTELRGSARFVSMGGAFTSLGGDLSCMSQNPAGLGMYRFSDIGLSFDISIRNYKNVSNFNSNSQTECRASFDNFGYVGVAKLDGAMPYFQWGFSYNRLARFDRKIRNYSNPTATSLSNYIASYTNGVPTNYDPARSDLGFLLDDPDGPDPFGSGADWLSILAYNAYMINGVGDSDDRYAGLYQNGTQGDAGYEGIERGYLDEYNIDFAGNISDVVYWGVGVGIYDLEYTLQSNYDESMKGALVPQVDGPLTTGNGYFNLYNWKSITGTGANLKFGLIVRPVDEIRIGLAVHTPTWMHLTHQGYGDVTTFRYSADVPVNESERTIEDGYYTPDYDYRSRLTTPWRFMCGISGVVGGRGIVSVDYERVSYGDMKMKSESGMFDGFEDNTFANNDIKSYYRAANIVRIGAEYRVDNNWSVRAGYNWQGSCVKQEAKAPGAMIYTSGTDPSYSFFNDRQNFSLGVGYRYGGWYADFAWQITKRKGTWHAYTDFDGLLAPRASVTDTYNNLVFTTGFRF